MKKALIAGAASTVLAAMPVVGVFAEGATTGPSAYTDSFEFTISNICTFRRGISASGSITDGSEHTAATNGEQTDNWVAGTGENDTTDKLTLTNVTAGKTYSMGSSSFTVICNDTKGYDINIAPSVLTNTTTNAAKDQISVGEQAVSTDASSWTITKTGDSPAVYYTTTNSKIQTNANPNDATDGDNFTVNYNLGLKSSQAAGTYTGNVVYTLTHPAAE